MANTKPKKTDKDIENNNKSKDLGYDAAPQHRVNNKLAKVKKPKKQDESELDDVLLDDAGDLGGEELPELAEFDADEVDEPEDQDADDDTDDADDDALEGSDSPDDVPAHRDDEIILTDAEGRRLCRVRDCDQAATVDTYCRFHYLQNWKRIQIRRKILADGKLERYVEEFTSRYPDKFLEMIRKDLRAEKEFVAAIAELEIDESGLDNEFEEENQTYIEEVRGVSDGNVSEDDDF